MMTNPTMLSEFRELRSIILRFAGVFCLVAIGVYAIGEPSLALRLFAYMKATLLPQGVTIVTLGPLASFIAPITLSLLIAFLVAFPYLLLLLLRYILPALYPQERRSLVALFVSSIGLFFLGCAFGYFLLIPNTFAILYSFAPELGVTPFFSLEAFVGGVFGLTVATGISFLVPIFMILLSKIHLVPAQFWRAHWRAAVAGVIIFSAIITPDGSGVTMVILSAPLLLLYGAGVLLTK